MLERTPLPALGAGLGALLAATSVHAQEPTRGAPTRPAEATDQGAVACRRGLEGPSRRRLPARRAPRACRRKRGPRDRDRRTRRRRRRAGDPGCGAWLRRGRAGCSRAMDVRAGDEERRTRSRDRAALASFRAPALRGRTTWLVFPGDRVRVGVDRTHDPGRSGLGDDTGGSSLHRDPGRRVAAGGLDPGPRSQTDQRRRVGVLGARSRLCAAPRRLGAGHLARDARPRDGAALGRRKGQSVFSPRLRRRPRHRHRPVDRRHSDQHGVSRARAGLLRYELHHPRDRRARRTHQGPLLRQPGRLRHRGGGESRDPRRLRAQLDRLRGGRLARGGLAFVSRPSRREPEVRIDEGVLRGRDRAPERTLREPRRVGQATNSSTRSPSRSARRPRR